MSDIVFSSGGVDGLGDLTGPGQQLAKPHTGIACPWRFGLSTGA
jgi:hypothetical protein